MATPTVESVYSNLLAARQSASRKQVLEGRAWYAQTRAFIDGIADDAYNYTGDRIDTGLAVAIFSSYSQNQGWAGNVTMATRYLRGEGLKGLTTVCEEIEALEAGQDPTAIVRKDRASGPIHEPFLGLKRADFWRNIMGDESAVTCDRWHLRAALGLLDAPKEKSIALTPKIHAVVTEATQRLARRYRETPAQCQAVIWCAVRGDGK